MAAEDDALDEELEQLLPLVPIGDREQRVEVLEDMAELVRLQRFPGSSVDLGLQAGEVVLKQSEVPLLQRQLGPDGLKAGPAIGDGPHEPVHLRACLVDAVQQLGLLGPKGPGAVVISSVGGGDGGVEQLSIGAELGNLVLGPLLDLVGIDLADRALLPAALERGRAAIPRVLLPALGAYVVQRHARAARATFEQPGKREGALNLGDLPGACWLGGLHSVPQLTRDDGLVNAGSCSTIGGTDFALVDGVAQDGLDGGATPGAPLAVGDPQGLQPCAHSHCRWMFQEQLEDPARGLTFVFDNEQLALLGRVAVRAPAAIPLALVGAQLTLEFHLRRDDVAVELVHHRELSLEQRALWCRRELVGRAGELDAGVALDALQHRVDFEGAAPAISVVRHGLIELVGNRVADQRLESGALVELGAALGVLVDPKDVTVSVRYPTAQEILLRLDRVVRPAFELLLRRHAHVERITLALAGDWRACGS